MSLEITGKTEQNQWFCQIHILGKELIKQELNDISCNDLTVNSEIRVHHPECSLSENSLHMKITQCNFNYRTRGKLRSLYYTI